MTDWSLNVMPGTPVRRGGKRPSPKLNLRWWKSTLIVARRYSSVIIVQRPDGMVPCLVCLSLAISITKGKKTANRAVTNARPHWLVLTECPCVRWFCRYVCVWTLTHVPGAYRILPSLQVWQQSNYWLKHRWKTLTGKKTQMWQQGTWKYGTPPPPSASAVHNVKTPNSRTMLDFLYFPVQRSYSILDLRSGSFGFELVWSSPWCRDWSCVYTATVADLLFDTSHKIDASQMMSYNKGSVAMWTKRWAIQTEELRRLLELLLEFQ